MRIFIYVQSQNRDAIISSSKHLLEPRPTPLWPRSACVPSRISVSLFCIGPNLNAASLQILDPIKYHLDRVTVRCIREAPTTRLFVIRRTHVPHSLCDTQHRPGRRPTHQFVYFNTASSYQIAGVARVCIQSMISKPVPARARKAEISRFITSVA